MPVAESLWPQALARYPFAAALLPGWREHAEALPAAYQAGLEAAIAAFDSELTLGERYRKLVKSRDCLATLMGEGDEHIATQLLRIRVHIAFGESNIVRPIAETLQQALEAGHIPQLDRPFLPALESFDRCPLESNPCDWLLALVLDTVTQLNAESRHTNPAQNLPQLAQRRKLPCVSIESERMLALAAVRLGKKVTLKKGGRLMSEGNNLHLWERLSEIGAGGFTSNVNKHVKISTPEARFKSVLQASGNKFIHLRYPLIYGISLFDEHVRNAAKSMGLDYRCIKKNEDIIKEICSGNTKKLIFTGHSYFNLTIKCPPYVLDELNIFSIYNVVPFSIIDDHAYADFMLHRCKNSPQEIIIGSTSHDLLDEFETISQSKLVHKIKIPSKTPEFDNISFEEKENRAVFLGKLYDNIPKSVTIIKKKVLSDGRISKTDKELIFRMIKGRESDAFFTLPTHQLNAVDLVLLYLDLVDKFFRNFHRERELEKIVRAFKRHSIPVYVVGGDKSSWSFVGKEDCFFGPKISYKEAVNFLHKSKYNINLTPSYADILTSRAIDMMGSNSLCISDYSPYYEKLEKSNFYYGYDFVKSKDFNEVSIREAAKSQKKYMLSLFKKEKVEEEWCSCIAQAYEIILSRGP